MPTNLWSDDTAQFARLIAEMESLGILATHQEQIQTELDLEPNEFAELIDRAQATYDANKARIPRPGAITTRVPLDTLKQTAERIAERQGHQLAPWVNTLTHGSAATCARCQASVTANPNPRRNDLDLTGLALTTACPERTTNAR